jgi:hypothetical protein
MTTAQGDQHYPRRSEAQCPGCGGDVTIPGRVYCRPSCRVRHEWRDRRSTPSLFTLGAELQSEWPAEDSNA